jgi:hypothetical protein
VTPTDLRDLADSFEVRQDTIEETYEERWAGTITADEADERIEEANKTIVADLKDIATAVETRTEETLQSGKPITGHPLVDSVVTTAIGLYLLGKKRDRNRLKRGEPVTLTKPAV